MSLDTSPRGKAIHRIPLLDGSVLSAWDVKVIKCPQCPRHVHMVGVSGGNPGEFPPEGILVVTHDAPPCSFFQTTSDDVAMWRGIFEVTRA